MTLWYDKTIFTETFTLLHKASSYFELSMEKEREQIEGNMTPAITAIQHRTEFVRDP